LLSYALTTLTAQYPDSVVLLRGEMAFSNRGLQKTADP
jgi:hypothetical protein